jgi:hypothetical protein
MLLVLSRIFLTCTLGNFTIKVCIAFKVSELQFVYVVFAMLFSENCNLVNEKGSPCDRCYDLENISVLNLIITLVLKKTANFFRRKIGKIA